jgi:hypothetical protein
MSLDEAPADLLTLPDIAERLHCSVSWLRGQIEAGALVAAKVAGKWLVEPGDLRVFFEGLKNHRPPTPVVLPTAKRGLPIGTQILPNGAAIKAEALRILAEMSAPPRSSSAGPKRQPRR